MGASGRQSSLPAVILLGLAYAAIGVGFAALANPAAHQARFIWRLSAWVASAAVYAAHIGYEHYRLDNSPRSTALHAAVAVALGGFGLAVSASLHSRHPLVLALALWPIITGLPAFLVALAVGAVLARFARSG